MATVPQISVGDDYREKYGFFDPEKYVFKARRGENKKLPVRSRPSDLRTGATRQTTRPEKTD